MPTSAPCCVLALKQATDRWPNRRRASDGILGDEAHQRRRSDHNEGNAFDLTHDPENGPDCNELSRQVIDDARVTYVIWNRQIYNRDRAAEGWRPYTGSNPHIHHMHVSIRASMRDDLSPWPWSPEESEEDGANPTTSTAYPGRPLQRGDRGAAVRTIQQWLNYRGYGVAVDASFGPATYQAVRNFQRDRFLTVDGVVGPVTWGALVSMNPHYSSSGSMCSLP